MSKSASDLRRRYLAEMLHADGDNSVLARVRVLWWPTFVQRFATDGASILNRLDLCMNENRTRLAALASEYATAAGATQGTDRHRQLSSQFLKSNTGKMFERFVGLALAHALEQADAPYCILPFRQDTLPFCHGISHTSFGVNVTLGETVRVTTIDADLFAFNPANANADIFMISIKSTLKDRFHNVPFWNLLRHVAVNRTLQNTEAVDDALLRKVRYVAICSDLAAEQPDFSADQGPRNLLSIDAALLDGAYVTASGAKGLGKDAEHIGFLRKAPFYPLVSFFEHLCRA